MHLESNQHSKKADTHSGICFFGAGVRFAVPGVRLADRAAALHTDRCTPIDSAVSATGGAEPIGPNSNLRFESYQHSKKADTHSGICFFGAGDRTRTGTSVTSRDFKSLVSTYSTTPA